MPSLTFSFVTYSWDSKSYILTTVYLFSDHPTSLAKRKTQHIILDPLSLQHYCKYLITIICNAINNNIICVRFEFLVPVFSFQVPHLNKFAPQHFIYLFLQQLQKMWFPLDTSLNFDLPYWFFNSFDTNRMLLSLPQIHRSMSIGQFSPCYPVILPIFQFTLQSQQVNLNQEH